MSKVSESIFSNRDVVIPLADVQHIEKRYHSCDLVNGTKKGDFSGIHIITKHTTWQVDCDFWANSIWIAGDAAHDFIKAWCFYRQEVEDAEDAKPAI